MAPKTSKPNVDLNGVIQARKQDVSYDESLQHTLFVPYWDLELVPTISRKIHTGQMNFNAAGVSKIISDVISFPSGTILNKQMEKKKP